MKKLLLLCLITGIVLWGTSTWAAFSSEVIVHPGPPLFEGLSDYDTTPTQITHVDPYKNISVSGGWYDANAHITTRWDEDFQGWVNTWTYIYKDLEVTAAGAASITFSFNGSIQVSGSTAQNGDYYSDVVAIVSDDTPDPANYEYWYESLDGPGSIDISETKVFNYLFDESDVGDIIEIYMELDFEIIPSLALRIAGEQLSFVDGESLDFITDFQEGIQIESITGGLAAVDGPGLAPAPVPVPGSLLLLAAGTLLLGWARKTA